MKQKIVDDDLLTGFTKDGESEKQDEGQEKDNKDDGSAVEAKESEGEKEEAEKTEASDETAEEKKDVTEVKKCFLKKSQRIINDNECCLPILILTLLTTHKNYILNIWDTLQRYIICMP